MDFWAELKQDASNRMQKAMTQVFSQINKLLTTNDKALDIYTVDLGEPVILSFHYKPREMVVRLTGFSKQASKIIDYDNIGLNREFGMIEELLDKYERS